MPSATDRRPGIRSRLAGAVLLASSLLLLSTYAQSQLEHTVRFLFEILIDADRILPF